MKAKSIRYRAGYKCGDVWINSDWVQSKAGAEKRIDEWRKLNFTYPMRIEKQETEAEAVHPSDQGFETWWEQEGSAGPAPGEELETFMREKCRIAWSNGAYMATRNEERTPTHERK